MQGKISVCKVLGPIQVAPVKNVFPSTKIQIAYISANDWVSVSAQFLLKTNATHMLVMSSLFG